MKILVLLMLAVPAGFAAEYDAKAAFERLKTLAGEWEGKLGADTGKVSYEVISGGSAILERFTSSALPPGGNMVSVFHLDGKRLMMTHYCLAQNQPRLVAKSYDAGKGELVFEFLDVTNASAGVGYISGAIFRFGDGKRFTSSWRSTKDGQAGPYENFDFTRVR